VVYHRATRLVGCGVPHLYVAGVPGGVCAYSRGLLESLGANWVGIEPAAHWVYVDQEDAFAHHVAAFVTALR
jgi:pimeloyl-ACP methyl ester carboxylesterase